MANGHCIFEETIGRGFVSNIGHHGHWFDKDGIEVGEGKRRA